MKKKSIIITGAAVFTVLFIYLLFNWTMSALIHSRKEVMVPDLKGKSLQEAVAVLSPLNLGLRKDGEVPDQNLPAGMIMRQTPLAGMPVREGKIVRVTISEGGTVIYVPDVTGQAVRSAEITIRSSGLTLGEESSRYSLMYKKDRVITQDPAPGSIAEKDVMVNLVISAGLPTGNIKLMPDFRGKNISEARGWAEQNGFSVEILEEAAGLAAPGSILRQDPAPDSDLSGTGKIIFSVAGTGSQDAGSPRQGMMFHYEIPQGGGDRQVRLTLLDENGERELFQGVRPPGTKLDIPVNGKGHARVRVFVNSILVEERDVYQNGGQ
ncbi:MAG: PASTA domain-containing protein [Endomicrobiales bacterium]